MQWKNVPNAFKSVSLRSFTTVRMNRGPHKRLQYLSSNQLNTPSPEQHHSTSDLTLNYTAPVLMTSFSFAILNKSNDPHASSIVTPPAGAYEMPSVLNAKHLISSNKTLCIGSTKTSVHSQSQSCQVTAPFHSLCRTCRNQRQLWPKWIERHSIVCHACGFSFEEHTW